MGGAAAGDRLVTVQEYAERQRVTLQCVYGWIKRGVISATEAADGTKRIDAARADTELQNRRRAGGHGGRRRGSGRKPDEQTKPPEAAGREAARPAPPHDRTERNGAPDGPTPPRQDGGGRDRPLSPTVAEPRRAYGGAAGKVLDRLQARKDGDEPEPGRGEAVTVEDLLSLTWDELKVLATLPPDLTGLTDNKLSRLKVIEDTRRLQLANEEKAGALVDVDDLASALAAHDAVVRQQIEGLSNEIARDLAARLWAPADLRGEVADLLRSVGCDGDAVASALAMLEPPPDLEEAIRRLVAQKVDRACEMVAGAGLVQSRPSGREAGESRELAEAGGGGS